MNNNANNNSVLSKPCRPYIHNNNKHDINYS